MEKNRENQEGIVWLSASAIACLELRKLYKIRPKLRCCTWFQDGHEKASPEAGIWWSEFDGSLTKI